MRVVTVCCLYDSDFRHLIIVLVYRVMIFDTALKIS